MQVPELSGHIDGCCCDAKTADEANNKHVLPVLHELTKM